ncbi:MAG: NAD(P)-dependent oxidoreductase [Candidatus Eisenbacteria bacterium]
MRILTSGALSGLGKHLYERFGGLAWTRQLPAHDREEIKREGVDVVFHCAATSRRPVTSDDLYEYIADNVLLTEELVSVPHRKFVFVSSVDVYPCGHEPRSENSVIDVDTVRGIYGKTKLMSEAIVQRHCPDHLILRCVALLGEHARKNSLTRILDDDSCTLTLSGDSQFNYVLHEDVSEFIESAVKNDVRGIYNVASSENVTLSEVVDIFNRRVDFGAYRYAISDVDNKRIASIFPAFRKTSKEVVARFARERAGRRQRCS